MPGKVKKNEILKNEAQNEAGIFWESLTSSGETVFKCVHQTFYGVYGHAEVFGRFAQLRSLRQWKNREHTTHQSKNIRKNFKANMIFPYLSPIPICPKLFHMVYERFFSQNPKIAKNCLNSTREHSKELPNLKLSKIGRFMIIPHIEKILSWFLTWGVP